MRSRKELEYSLTLRPLDTNAANLVAISRYQYVQLLPARVVSAYSTRTMLAIFLSCCYHAFALAQHLNLLVPSFLKVGLNLNSFSCSFLYFFPRVLFSLASSRVFDFPNWHGHLETTNLPARSIASGYGEYAASGGAITKKAESRTIACCLNYKAVSLWIPHFSSDAGRHESNS